MSPSEQIDARIKELDDWRGPVFAQLRTIINEAAPEAKEVWKWNTAVWEYKGLLCAIGAFKDSVGINFFKGASLPDPKKLFNAGLEAKLTRMVKFFEGEKINEPAVKALVKAAFEYNDAK